METTEKRRELAEQYIAVHDNRAAIRVLFELAVDCAKAKDFAGAESSRNRILEIDPMALDEIVRSGEIIDEEKEHAIDREHRETWAALYDSLTIEEANALYFSLKHRAVAQDEIVYAQGDLNQRLFFLNSGRLKITCSQGETEVLLAMLNPGQIVGEDTFFSSSVCTTSLSAASASLLSYLEPEVLAEWRKYYPVLESKLLEFISRFEKVNDILKSKVFERRALKRARANGRLDVQLVNSSGSPVGNPFKVELYDISQGGACVLVQILKKESARVLLGRRLKFGILHSKAGVEVDLNRTGTIAAVQFHPFEDCTVHIHFLETLTEATIMDLVRLS